MSIKGKEQILRADRNLFARMTVIAQTRDMDMREVLKYTQGPLPWSLATPEGLYVKTSKSKLAEVLEKDVDPCAEEPDASVYILDGMALLQSIKNVPRTFGDLAEYMLKLIIRTSRNLFELTLSQIHIQNYQLKTWKGQNEQLVVPTL